MKLSFLLAIFCCHVRCNVINTGYFWQVTDFHYDANYSMAGDPTAMCHQGNGGNHINSVFGNYLCDSPMKLIVSAINAMKTLHPNPDFIFWTGDSVPHVKDSELNQMKIYHNIGNVTEQLLKVFPTIPIYPVLGNHDEYPKDAFPDVNTSYYSNILSVSHWSKLLIQSDAEQFKVGGYYKADLGTSLIVLGLNTNLYYGFNPLTNHSIDPAGQFSWLEGQLKLARQKNQKVIIISHIAPGMFELKSGLMWFKLRFNNRYVSILMQYNDVISTQIYGHEHTDSFRILKDSKGNAVGTLFLSPAVTPWKSTLPGVGSNNPGIRLYEYNKQTGEIINYHQYFLNLSKAIATGKDQWEKEYDVKQYLGLDSASPDAFMSAAMSFRQNKQLFKKYLQFNSASQNLNPVCNDKCLKVHICSITELQIANYNLCLNSPYPTTSTEAPWHSRPHPHPGPHNGKLVPKYMVIIICTLAALVFVAAVVIAIICIKRHTISIPHRYNRFNSQLGKGPIN